MAGELRQVSVGSRQRRRILAVAIIAALATGLAAHLFASEARAGVFLRGFADPVFKSADESRRAQWVDASAQAGAAVARIDVIWASVAPDRPTSPRNPADPVYRWEQLDAAVRSVVARGLIPLLTVYKAPRWAEGEDRARVPPGTWKPDPDAFGAFGEAVGRRYSGSFPTAEGVLPRVTYFEAWNEPNLGYFLTPQGENGVNVAVERYRRMLNAFYAGVHGANPGAKVVAGATAPYGDDPGDPDRTRPLHFLRKLLCVDVDEQGRFHREGCEAKASLDVISHHPINLTEGPTYSAQHPDDATTADFRHVTAALRAAERKGTIEPAGRRPAWATEIWWESEPPHDADDDLDTPLRQHARWVEQAMYLLAKQGADAMIWLQVIDSALAKGDPGGAPTLQTGVYFHSGEKKPAFTAFRFPFVTDRRSKRRVRAWTIPPASGRLEIQRKGRSGWRVIKRANVRRGRTFQKTIKAKGTETFRATVSGEHSLAWTQKGKKRRRGG